MPNSKDPTVKPIQLPPRYPASDCVLTDPRSHELRERDHTVLTLGDSRDRRIDWGAFFPHGRE